MYGVIQMTMPIVKKDLCSIDIFNEEVSFEDELDKFYTEAVFIDGHEKIQPLEETAKKLLDKFKEMLSEQERNPDDKAKAFNPSKYWKDPLWKEFEEQIMQIFGFRDVRVNPYKEKYNSKSKEFESKELNCVVYNENRFPISGLVTDEGFYDKSKSLRMDLFISLGLLKVITPKEMIAIFLHEFGHTIDPALTDISYIETNILSKYLTDRQKSLSKNENRYMKERKFGSTFNMLKTVISGRLKNALFGGLFDSTEKAAKKKLEKLKEELSKHKEIFNRQSYKEAYADNFARMYGYGGALLSGMQKIDKHYDDKISSRYKKEKDRQNIILSMTIDAIKDVHKTDIHRCKALINEYKEDLKDPNIPDRVKTQIKDDMEELEKVMDAFFNNFSDFQNRVNKMISDSIDDVYKSNEEK